MWPDKGMVQLKGKLQRFFIMNIKIPLFLVLLLTSCTYQRLSVQTAYLSRESLASYYVQTPDPQLDTPPIGQRLIISWCIPKNFLDYPDLHLQITVRLRNREQETRQVPLTKTRGTYLYEILNEKFCQSGGIRTYKIDLIGHNCVLEKWQHPLWVDSITFDFPQTMQ